MDKQRLDFLVAKELGVSRSLAVSLIEAGKVKVGGAIKNKPSLKVSEGSNLEIKKVASPKPGELKLTVVYEDNDCVVIDKPAGVLAHAKGVFSVEDTVATWLAPRTEGFEANNNRAGIVHRLDRGTSGVMICAKTPESLAYLQKQFSGRKVKKTYHAVIKGAISPEKAVIDIPIERNPKDPKRFKAGSNGKQALTEYETVKTFLNYSLLKLLPKTGRTHQLRVHLAYMKCPIVGDDFYGGIAADRLYLHASELEITLPNGDRKIFSSNLPDAFSNPRIRSNG